MPSIRLPLVLLALMQLAVPMASAADADGYQLQPGDFVTISVWREQNLQADVLVRPDGGLTFPLAGEQMAAGHTVDELRKAIEEKLAKYIPDPAVTVSLKAIGGNRLYIVGKVLKPGEFPFVKALDVMQSLAMAGGTSPFAAVNDIRILRRENGKQVSIPFRYDDVAAGKKLEQNIVLRSGDTVIVP